MALENIDFKLGTVLYNDFHIDPNASIQEQIAYLDEDLIQVDYPEGYVLDVGWYHGINGRYVVRIIKDCDWSEPISRKETRDFKRLEKYIQKSVHLVMNLLSSKYERVETEIMPYNFDRKKFIAFFDEEYVFDKEAGSYFYSIELKNTLQLNVSILIVDRFVKIELLEKSFKNSGSIFDVGISDITQLELYENKESGHVALNLYKNINNACLTIRIKPDISLEVSV